VIKQIKIKLLKMFLRIFKTLVKLTGLAIFIIAIVLSIDIYKNLILEKSKSVKISEKESRQNIYDRDFLYKIPGNAPVIKINPLNNITYFILDQNRNENSLMYFDKLFNESKINIISPSWGLSSLPNRYKMTEWFYEEDTRNIIQLYDLHSTHLKKDHKIIVISFSFGALINSAIAARSNRKPDLLLLYSPINTKIIFGKADIHDRYDYICYLLSMYSKSENSMTDAFEKVFSDRLSTKNWEIYTKKVMKLDKKYNHKFRIMEAAYYYQYDLTPRVNEYKVYITAGTNDQYFSSESYNDLNDLYNNVQNISKIQYIPAGHIENFNSGLIQNNCDEILKEYKPF